MSVQPGQRVKFLATTDTRTQVQLVGTVTDVADTGRVYVRVRFDTDPGSPLGGQAEVVFRLSADRVVPVR